MEIVCELGRHLAVGHVFLSGRFRGHCVAVPVLSSLVLHVHLPQFIAQLPKVVDFANVGDPKGPILIRQGHVPTLGQIEDSQSSASKTYISVVGKW